MPRSCAMNECKRTSCARCHCCGQDLCLQHLQEHHDVLLAQLDPLADQMNRLETRLKGFQIQSMMDYARSKLEQWRQDCYKKIDEFFESKCQELLVCANEKINRQHGQLEDVRTQLSRLMSEEDVTKDDIEQLKEKVRQLQKSMDQMQHTMFKVDIQGYRINDDLIRIEEFNANEFDLNMLSSANKTISCEKKACGAVATNNDVLLMYQDSYLCLFDRDLNLLRKNQWTFGEIWDMFWSSTLNQFLIINENHVFLIDEQTMFIENIQMVAKQTWCCGTCSERSLFLATYQRGSSIMEFSLVPSIEFIKQWKSSEICSKDEGIHDLNYCHEKLFLIIENQVKRRVRIDLRTAMTFDRIWSLSLDSVANQNVQIRCCTLYNDEWIIAHHDMGRLLHISKDGELKHSRIYSPAPHFVCSFGSHGLLVVTSHAVNLHRISLPKII